MKTSKLQIENFLNSNKIAVAGASGNNKKFGYLVFSMLKKNNYKVIPVNPNATEIDGTKCYAGISQIPDKIESLLIITPQKHTNEILKNAIDIGIKNIWVQQKSETPETYEIAKNNNIEIILNQCIFMYANPKGIHKFHRGIKKVFGKLPK